MIKKIPECWKTLAILVFSLFGFSLLEDFCHSIFTALKMFFDMRGTYPWFKHLHYILSLITPLILMKWAGIKWMGNSKVPAKSLFTSTWKFILLSFGLVVLGALLRILAEEFSSLLVFAAKGSLLVPWQQLAIKANSALENYYFVAFVGPLREELCHRSLLLQRLQWHFSKSTAVMVMSAIFAFVHLPSLVWQRPVAWGFLKMFLLFDAPDLLLMGCAFGLVFLRYGLVGSFAIHTIYNVLVLNREIVTDNFEFVFPIGVVGIVFLILECRHFKISALTKYEKTGLKARFVQNY